jgi:microcystin-dependent protein
MPIGAGQGPGLLNYMMGQTGGVQRASISFAQLPRHTHTLNIFDFSTNQYVAQAPAKIGDAGASQPILLQSPYVVVNWIIAVTGITPTARRELGAEDPGRCDEHKPEGHRALDAAQPVLGELVAAGFNFAPPGWAQCDGQLLQVSAFTALFSLIGTTFGGDGVTTFALPDLRERTPIGPGQGPGLSDYVRGRPGGIDATVLTVAQLFAHTHTFPV